MGTLPNKKYPQVVTRQEVAFLVLGYLKEEKFKQTLEIFEKEAKNVIKNMKLASKKVKSLHSILNEYIFLKNEEKKKTKFINTFGQDPNTKKTMQNLHDLLEDYSMYRDMFLPQRPAQDLDDPIPVNNNKSNKNSTPAQTPAINTPMTAITNTPMSLNMNTPSIMQIDPPQIDIQPMEVHNNNDNQSANNNTNVMDTASNTSPSNTNSRPVPQLPVIEILESPGPKQPVSRTTEGSTTNNNNNHVTSDTATDNTSVLLSPTNANKTVTRTPITSTPRRKPKPRKYSPSPKAKQSLNFEADAEQNQVHEEMSREFMENGFKLLMQNQPLQQKLADLINSRLTSPEPVVADPNEWIPPNAIDEILNSLTADPMFEPLFQSEHVDTLNLSHQSNDSHSSNNINAASHQTLDSNPNNNTIMSNHSNNNNNNIDRDNSFERLNTSTDNLLNFNAFDKGYQNNTYAHTDEIDFAALLNTSTEEVDQHAQNTASFFHSILQSTETLTPLNEELDNVHANAQSGDNNHVSGVNSNNNNCNVDAPIVVPQQIEDHDKNTQRHVSTEWRNFLNNSSTVNAVQNTDSNSALVHNNNNSNSSDENSKSKTSQLRKRKILGTKRTASTLGGETEQQNKKQKLEETKMPENLDVELFLSQLNYK